MWAMVREMLTLVLLESDDLREAERYLIEVGDLADQTIDAMTLHPVTLARIRAAQARADEADALFREALDHPKAARMATIRARVRRDDGEFLLAQGRAVEGRAQLDQALVFYADPEAESRRRGIDAIVRRYDQAAVD